MTTDRERQLNAAFGKIYEEIMKILYEEDPAIMGSLIQAPDDEYSTEAQSLIIALKGTTTRADVRQVLERQFSKVPNISDRLVERVFDSWRTFTAT